MYILSKQFVILLVASASYSCLPKSVSQVQSEQENMSLKSPAELLRDMYIYSYSTKEGQIEVSIPGGCTIKDLVPIGQTCDQCALQFKAQYSCTGNLAEVNPAIVTQIPKPETSDDTRGLILVNSILR